MTEALEREQASSGVLRIVSEAGSDAMPVFEAILGNAVRLCDAKLGQLCLRDGENLRWVASHGATAPPEGAKVGYPQKTTMRK